VIGANYRALGVVRSLARRRIPVRVVKHDDASIATLSRYAGRPLAWSVGDGVEQLMELAERHSLEGWTLIPTDDTTAVLLARAHERLSERHLVAAPEWETLRWCYDKRLTYRLGDEVGVGQPRTWFADRIEEVAAADWRPPAILKPAIKRGRSRFVVEKAWPVTDQATLRRRYAAAQAVVPTDEIMLQELIPGDGHAQLSFAALADGGRVLASVTARRTRQIPMDFGRESTYVETVVAPDVADAGTRLIAGMRYTGVLEIEFKRDARNGRLKLLDMNPRAWGWQTLGARAGVDFPYLHWRMLHGEPVPEVRGRAGVRWVRTTTDLPVVLREIAAGRMSIASYRASLKGPLEHAMLVRDDPLPGLADAPLTALIHLRAQLLRLRPRRR
jgi:D-aspartate ligase